ARPDGGRQAGEGAGRAHRRGGVDADGTRGLPDQPLPPRLQPVRHGRSRARVAAKAGMKVRFWGTRGSIPVSVTAADIRAKLLAALAGAVGRGLDTPEKIADYVDRQLDFEVAGTFGGHSSCVQVTAPDSSHVILDMGTGARPLGQHLLAKYG